MDLSVVFCLLIAADLVVLRCIPAHRRVARFACASIEINWRSTHLRNGANDVVIVPNSTVAKIRILNHSAGTKRYSESLTVSVDYRNEPELTLEVLKQAAMTCPSIVENPAPSAQATEIKGERRRKSQTECEDHPASFSGGGTTVGARDGN
jgi:Mechanosensitive ion channel